VAASETLRGNDGLAETTSNMDTRFAGACALNLRALRVA